MFEDDDGASLDNVVGHSLVVTDAHEGMVTVAVMDLAAPASMAVVGWVDWEAELGTECRSKEVVVESIGGNDAAHTYKGEGHLAA